MPLMIEKARTGRLAALEALGRTRAEGADLPLWLAPAQTAIRFQSTRPV